MDFASKVFCKMHGQEPSDLAIGKHCRIEAFKDILHDGSPNDCTRLDPISPQI